jgi:hypothetical protein
MRKIKLELKLKKGMFFYLFIFFQDRNIKYRPRAGLYERLVPIRYITSHRSCA